MAHARDDHRRLILDQFTRQAVPFSQMRDHSPELILVAAEVRADDMVLDVACGPGLMACAFAAVAGHVTGIDLTPAMIERAKILQESKALPNLTVTFEDPYIRVYGDTAVNTGYYTFSYEKDGATQSLPARYSFTLVKRDGDWQIVDHHSSAMPQ